MSEKTLNDDMELGDCPCCGETAKSEDTPIVYLHLSDGVCVECGACGTRGPVEVGLDGAGKAWNELAALRASLVLAEARSEYWKAEHLAGNAEIDRWKAKARKLGEWARALRADYAAEKLNTKDMTEEADQAATRVAKLEAACRESLRLHAFICPPGQCEGSECKVLRDALSEARMPTVPK